MIIQEYEEADFLQLVEVYKSAFAEPPWDEFFKCPSCSINYGIEESKSPPVTCKKCSNPLKLEEFWSEKEIKADLDFARSRSQNLVLIARDKNEMVGFTWGYQLPFEKFPFLEGKVSIKTNYMDEIAVKSQYRGSGIGKRLGQEYIAKLNSKCIPEIVLRTDQRNTASMNLFQSLGFERTGISDPEFEWRIYLRRKIT